MEHIIIPVTAGTALPQLININYLPPKKNKNHSKTNIPVPSFMYGMGVAHRLASNASAVANFKACFPSYPPILCNKIPPTVTPSIGAVNEMPRYALNTKCYGISNTILK